MRNGVSPLFLMEEQIADAADVTPVHVNRSLRTLRDAEFVSITGG